MYETPGSDVVQVTVTKDAVEKRGPMEYVRNPERVKFGQKV